ncbi:MAG: AEC family transporter [Clostridia bacterium]|nr:AEC family transporter [Clostridia bacterium]
MEVFNLTLQQMLVMFIIMAAGYILRKGNYIPENSSVAISKILAFFLAPALTLQNMAVNCTPETFIENSRLFIYSIVIVLIAVGISYCLSALFVRNKEKSRELEYQRQIYKYALTFGNYGYMGTYIILGIWGDEMLFKYNMFCLVLSIVVYSWGIYILVPKSENSPGILDNLKAGLTTPTMISILLGVIIGLSGLSRFIPGFVLSSMETAGNCMGPMSMLLAGIVIGEYNLPELMKNKKIYLVSLLRLIILPALFVGALKLMNLPGDIMIVVLIAFATPLGLNTVVFPSAYGGDKKTGASMTVISSLLSIITIPLMYYVFLVLM